MRHRAASAVVLALLLGACQTGAAAPGGTQPVVSGAPTQAPTADTGTQPDQTESGQISGVDGTVSYTVDTHNGTADSFTDSHKTMSMTLDLVAPADGGAFLNDTGSTFVYAETDMSHDAQRTGSCGLDIKSNGSGSGPFGDPGGLVGIYRPSEGTVSLKVRAPYTVQGTSTFLCNGLTQSGSSDELETTSCGDPGGAELVGRILPGNVVDFTCTESFPIGSGGVTVTGKLTSH